MKVLFLDIDGVVNCVTTAQRHRGAIGIDPYMSLLVNRIAEATGAQIVLSSTWRLWKESREEVNRYIFPNPIDSTPHIFRDKETKEIVPYRNTGGIEMVLRGEEIKAWLDEHPEVTRYAILDDNSDMLPGQPLFKTSWSTGLTQEIADEVIRHLTL
jgi:hypothetical protein